MDYAAMAIRGRKLANHLSARYGESAADRQPQRDYLKDHPPPKAIPSARVAFRNLEVTRGLPKGANEKRMLVLSPVFHSYTDDREASGKNDGYSRFISERQRRNSRG